MIQFQELWRHASVSEQPQKSTSQLLLLMQSLVEDGPKLGILLWELNGVHLLIFWLVLKFSETLKLMTNQHGLSNSITKILMRCYSPPVIWHFGLSWAETMQLEVIMPTHKRALNHPLQTHHHTQLPCIEDRVPWKILGSVFKITVQLSVQELLFMVRTISVELMHLLFKKVVPMSTLEIRQQPTTSTTGLRLITTKWPRTIISSTEETTPK